MVTHGDERVSMGQIRQRTKKIIGTLYMSAHGIRNSNQAILQETATGSTIPPALTENFDTNMLTRICLR